MREFGIWVPSDCVASRRAALGRRALALLAESMGVRTDPASAIQAVFPRG